MQSGIDSIRTQLVNSLEDKEYRDLIVQESINQGIAFQIRAMRSDREWTQGQLGVLAGKPQSEISRLEDPDYEGYTLKTLCKLASAFDVAISVRFVPFSHLVDDMANGKNRSFSVASFQNDRGLHGRPQVGTQTSFLDSVNTAEQLGDLGSVVSMADYRIRATAAEQVYGKISEENYQWTTSQVLAR